MLQFRLGSIPVEVQPGHLLTGALFGFLALPRPGQQLSPTSWPGVTLADAEGGERTLTLVAIILSWMVIVFVSLLIHELGHAAVSRGFGYRPSIVLGFMGGHTSPNAPGEIPWHKHVALTLAGPGFGLLLALGCGVALLGAGERSDWLTYLLERGLWVNLVWSIFNLAPVEPLDGGAVALRVSMRAFGLRGYAVAQGLGLATALALGAVALSTGELILAVFALLFGSRSVQALLAYRRGEVLGLPDTSRVEALEQAQAALEKGEADEARRLAHGLLESKEGADPRVRARAHHLLGWMALKEGRGRAALDHFSQVQGRSVETHALAGAFSLIGDEERALSLWELAYRHRPGDSTLLHEYAGALIRAGREDEALRLPAVDGPAAYQCATRVLFIRGAYSEAARVGEAGLLRFPRADLAYDAACAQARAQNVRDALRLLRRARELGFSDRAYAATDADLTALHGQPEFDGWVTEAPGPTGNEDR